MIEVKDVTKAYGALRALDSLDMHVPQGAVYGLVGPNGAGKTTILNHITGALKPDSGEILVNGKPVFENTEVKEGIAYIPSDFYFNHQASIKDMSELHAAVYPRFSMERFTALQAIFNMDPGLRIHSLSKGMTKQVAFWLALSQTPDLLLLDEPLDGLDPAARRTVWQLVMNEVAERGMTVLTSSHNLRELTDVCDHVGIMNAGRMHLERTLSDLQENFVKVQVAWDDDAFKSPEGVHVLNLDQTGRLFTMVVRAGAEQTQAAVEATNPVFINILPLSLEEIFIFELGGGHYAESIFD